MIQRPKFEKPLPTSASEVTSKAASSQEYPVWKRRLGIGAVALSFASAAVLGIFANKAWESSEAHHSDAVLYDELADSQRYAADLETQERNIDLGHRAFLEEQAAGNQRIPFIGFGIGSLGATSVGIMLLINRREQSPEDMLLPQDPTES